MHACLLCAWCVNVAVMSVLEGTRPSQSLQERVSERDRVRARARVRVSREREINRQPPDHLLTRTLPRTMQTNWTTLNNKVFKKIGLTVPPNVINGVASQKPGVIEVVLNNMRLKLQQAAAPPRTASEVPVHYDDQYDGHEAEMYDMPTPPHRAERGGRKKKGPTFPPLGNRTATLPPQQRRAAAPRPPPQLHSNGPPRGGGPRRNYEPTPPPPPPRGSARGDYGDYDDMAAELEACQETMDIMQIKIEKLTRLVHLKEKRIEDLKRSIPV